MNCKYFILITLVLPFISLQIMHAEFLNPESWEDYPLLENVTDLFNELKNQTDTAIADAKKAYNGRLDGLNATAVSTLSNTETTVLKIYDDFLGNIETIKENAGNSRVNIDECLEGNEDRLSNLPNELLTNFRDCVAKQNESAFGNILDNQLFMWDQWKYTVENLGNDINDCNSTNSTKEEVDECLTLLYSEIHRRINQIPQSIYEDITITGYTFDEMEYLTKQCAEDCINRLNNGGQNIVSNVGRCVIKSGAVCNFVIIKKRRV